MNETDTEASYTAGQVAAALGVNASTVYRWRRSGALTGVKIGREMRYPASIVAKFARSVGAL